MSLTQENGFEEYSELRDEADSAEIFAANDARYLTAVADAGRGSDANGFRRACEGLNRTWLRAPIFGELSLGQLVLEPIAFVINIRRSKYVTTLRTLEKSKTAVRTPIYRGVLLVRTCVNGGK